MARYLSILILAIVSLLTLGACDTLNQRSVSSPAAVNSGTGTVTSVDVVSGKDPGLVGALIGAVAGGVVGSKVGGGTGKTLATIAGTLGGAYAGREVEERIRNRDQVYRFTVNMDNGGSQTIAMDANPGINVGDRVRIDNGTIYRLS